MKKKKLTWISSLFIICTTLILSGSCSKESYDITDTDGNKYNSVTIGTQVWMSENLRTTSFNDGTPIALINNSNLWTKATDPAYCWYNNDVSKKGTYGALYNWQTINTGKLCPTGWHIPSDQEWITLFDYLGGDSNVGNKLKSTTGWYNRSNNMTATGASNSSGFTALPGGYRDYSTGTPDYMGYNGFWWSSTVAQVTGPYFVELTVEEPGVFIYSNNINNGYSVRCIEDN